MIADMTSYHSDTDLDAILGMIKEWVGDRIHKNLQIFVKQGKVKLELPHADLDKEHWDGTLLIHFVDTWSAKDVINYIAGGCGANEIDMIDDKTLRLWWD